MTIYVIHYDQSFRVEAETEEQALDLAWAAAKQTDPEDDRVRRVYDDTFVETVDEEQLAFEQKRGKSLMIRDLASRIGIPEGQSDE